MMAELKADLHMLLECLKCQLDNPKTVTQALQTIASLCTSNDAANDCLRDEGGLAFIQKLLITSGHAEVKEAALFTLGCAVCSCAHSQKQLSIGSVFGFLRDVLESNQSSVRYRRSACFLISSLVSNNRQGQMLVRNSNCLEILLNLFKSSLPCEPLEAREGPKDESWFENLEGPSMELWASVASTICSCLNNPQNDENQRLCASVFPHAVKFLEVHENPAIIRPIASLISLAAANNVYNQRRILHSGGIDILVNILHRSVNRLDQAHHGQLAICIVKTLDAILTDNASVAELCGSLGMVPLLIQLLSSTSINQSSHLHLMLALGHLVDASVTNQALLVEVGGVVLLIRRLTGGQADEEMSKAIRYVLHICVSNGAQVLASQPTPQRQRLQPVLNSARQHLGSVNDDLENVITQKFADIERHLEGRREQLDPLAVLRDVRSWSTEPDDGRPDTRLPQAPGSDQQRRWSAAAFRSPGDGHPPTSSVRLSSTGSQPRRWSTGSARTPIPRAPGHTRVNIRAEKLQQELTKERELRQQLEGEALDLRQAMADKNQAERVRHAAALTKELTRQENQQQTKPHHQEKSVKSKQKKPQSVRRKTQMTERLQGMEQQLKKLQREITDREDSDSTPSSVVSSVREDSSDSSDSECTGSVGLERDTAAKHGVGTEAEVTKGLVTSHATTGERKGSGPDKVTLTPRREEEEKEKRTIGLQTSPDSPLAETHSYNKETPSRGQNNLERHSVSVQTPGDLSQGVWSLPRDRHKGLNDGSPRQGEGGDSTGQAGKSDTNCNQFTRSSEGMRPLPMSSSMSAPWSKGDVIQRSSGQGSSWHTRETDIMSPEVRRPAERSDQCASSCSTIPLSVSTPQMKSADKLNRWPVVVLKPLGADDILLATPADRRLLVSAQFKSPAVPRRPQRKPAPPPSPCASEFDVDLLKCAARQGKSTSATCRFELLGSKENRCKDVLQNCSTPIQPSRRSRPPCAPYGRTASSTTSLRRILAENQSMSASSRRGSDFGGSGDGLHTDSGGSSMEYSPSSSTDSLASIDGISQTDTVIRQRLGNTRCPACQPAVTLNKPLLNSRTFNIAIETSSCTCALHRFIRLEERSLIAKISWNGPRQRPLAALSRATSGSIQKPKADPYHFAGSASDSEPSSSWGITPPESSAQDFSPQSKPGASHRRPRIPYTDQELVNLQTGVANMGKFWNQILNTYWFHPCRTGVDLKDKYRQLMSKSKVASKEPSLQPHRRKRNPFSLAEERRLRRGVKLYGYNWKAILRAFNFAKSRKPLDLKDKWQNMHKH